MKRTWNTFLYVIGMILIMISPTQPYKYVTILMGLAMIVIAYYFARRNRR